METSIGDNVGIPKELLLISLVSQQQALYNPKHQHYRSPQQKDEKWSEISSHVGWADTQCKAKWKAMRDQYCRELKRSKASAKANVKWKYFKELDFLRPYALARNYRTRPSANGTGAGAGAATLLPSGINTLTSTSSFNSNSNSQTLALSAIKVEDTQTRANKFGTIKIEEEPQRPTLMDSCDFVPSTTSATTAATTTMTVSTAVNSVPSQPITEAIKQKAALLMMGQMNNVLQQQQQQQSSQTDNNWNYLDDTSGTGTRDPVNNNNNNNNNNSDALYNDFVECVNAAPAVNQQSTHSQQQQQQQQQTIDEEDDDLIHTFLNIESYFEKELITLIQQEDMIYNYSNHNYRNVKLKVEAWEEIARKLKKPVKQCRQKWKALRDQYAREHKRLKGILNMDTHSRWKHYDSLSFLQKYIQQKTIDGDGQLNLLLPKHHNEVDLGEPMAMVSDHHSPLHVQDGRQSAEVKEVTSLPSLPPLTGPHKAELQSSLHSHTQSQEQPIGLCVTSYDDMDIENYITEYNATKDNGNDNSDDEDDDENGDDEDDDDNDDENVVDDIEEAEMEDVDTSTELQQQQQHHHHQQQHHHQHHHHQHQQHSVDYQTDKEHVFIAVQDVSNALVEAKVQTDADELRSSLETQQHHHHQQQQQQLAQAAQQQLLTSAEFSNKLRTHTPTLGTPTTGGYPLCGSRIATTTTTTGTTNDDEDEIGAFLHSVAMKIRSAHLNPVAFTELQIDILRVINEALRHH